MMVVAGESGAGKSTTLNRLYRHELFPTGTGKAVTRDIHVVTTVLEDAINISSKKTSNPFTFTLQMTDVPGGNDTDLEKDVENVALIQKLFTQNEDFQTRNLTIIERAVFSAHTEGKEMVDAVNSSGGKVYPNVVLLMCRANSTRLEGCFRQMLARLEVSGLIDVKEPNLAIVLTEANDLLNSLLEDEERELEENRKATGEFKKDIDSLVRDVLGFTVSPKVRFVENARSQEEYEKVATAQQRARKKKEMKNRTSGTIQPARESFTESDQPLIGLVLKDGSPCHHDLMVDVVDVCFKDPLGKAVFGIYRYSTNRGRAKLQLGRHLVKAAGAANELSGVQEREQKRMNELFQVQATWVGRKLVEAEDSSRTFT
ncbi:hypothetical protein HK097_004644 [Rhizophlyctis rosea]|uniref:G domain-containing protein n=1 Tax=Rhizophlyctis rosea TaxID=64517 RepID=A0AAD5X3H0_9FUNG|nr:hypothetical protein HK097_004644 [Rhizophlyctis rosea]